MSLYNIVSPASLVAGQPEDVSQVLANFQAIQAVLNGGLDDVNVRSTAAINPSKLAGFPSNAAMALRGDGSWNTIRPTRQVFNSGSGTYTTPAGVKAALVECIGGGGAGGGCPSTGPGVCSAAGGGAGGDYAATLIANPAATYAYAVGAGGVGVLNASGGPGGDTTFGAGIVVAKGNGGGAQAAAQAPPFMLASGGGAYLTSVGDVIVIGMFGSYGFCLAPNNSVGGRGGSGARGGSGGYEAVASTGNSGNPGRAPGGGGSGCANAQNQGGQGTGASGAAGQIVVTEFY